jgi:hypothetical protein
MTTIRARYEHGVLRPLTPLALAEGTEVDVSVVIPLLLTPPNPATTARDRLRLALVAAGLLAPIPSVDPTLHPLTTEALHAFWEQIPVGKPLSEIVIEDREERY